VSPLTAFGLFAVSAMLVCYWLERHERAEKPRYAEVLSPDAPNAW
jgi:hypothetical protein